MIYYNSDGWIARFASFSSWMSWIFRAIILGKENNRRWFMYNMPCHNDKCVCVCFRQLIKTIAYIYIFLNMALSTFILYTIQFELIWKQFMKSITLSAQMLTKFQKFWGHMHVYVLILPNSYFLYKILYKSSSG